METSKDRILWLDLETTGSETNAAVIEVGCVLTTGSYPFEELAEYQSVVGHTDFDPPQLYGLDEVVVKMHMQNGLFQELLLDNGTSSMKVENNILKYIFDPWVPGEVLVPLGGSGVSHFDRKYIKRDWVHLDSRLAYWSYDVGVMRRMLALAGVEFPQEEKAHRALADARQHLAEARTYIKWILDHRDAPPMTANHVLPGMSPVDPQ